MLPRGSQPRNISEAAVGRAVGTVGSSRRPFRRWSSRLPALPPDQSHRDTNCPNPNEDFRRVPRIEARDHRTGWPDRRDHAHGVSAGVCHVAVPVPCPAVVTYAKGIVPDWDRRHDRRSVDHGDGVPRDTVRYVDVPVPAVVTYAFGIRPDRNVRYQRRSGDYADGVREVVGDVDVPVPAVVTYAKGIVPDWDRRHDRRSVDHGDGVRTLVRHVDVPVLAVVPHAPGQAPDWDRRHDRRPVDHGDGVRAPVRHVDVPVPAVMSYAL